MDQTLKQDYTRRIAMANRSEIINIVFELANVYMTDAQNAIENNDDTKAWEECNRAKECIHHLIKSLDYQYELAQPLLRIYQFASKEITSSAVNHNVEGIQHAKKLMTTLAGAFYEASKQDTSEPVMSHTQTVYAGLTYGKNQLNESLTDEGSLRGLWV